MGLLLGASVLTIGEVADLFIYNMIRKCIEKKQEKEEQAKINPQKSAVPPAPKVGLVQMFHKW